MAFDLNKIVRQNILNIKPYSSARDEYTGSEGVFLDANENPFGSVGGGKYNRYPDPYQRDLKSKIAKIKRVAEENIFLGNGSDEAIDILFRIFCEPRQDNVIICPPTYGMYRVCADINDVEVKEVLLKENTFQLNVPKILEAVNSTTKAIFICSPNNPSGNIIDNEDIKKVLTSFTQGIVFIDEAYIDFTDQESWNQYLDLYPNLVVIQTFSKAWGLAGLRLGMAYASKEIIDFYNKVKYPYNIGRATLEAAHVALDNADQVFDYIDLINSEKATLIMLLSNIKEIKHIVPSDSNSILIFLDNASAIYTALTKELVIVRDRSKVVLCTDSLRISIGTPEENEIFFSALKKVLA
jgi:histidinol-phosphate aminotransferase